MIAIVREPEPEILKQKSVVSGQRLCERLKKYHAGQIRNKPEADAAIYRHPEVLAALHRMFKGRCVYCESVLPGRLDVEHFRPESLYPAIAYKWTNLLFACAFCNQDGKGAIFPLLPDGRQPVYDRSNPGMLDDTDSAMLINPCVEDPTEFFEFTNEMLGCKNERAEKTRDVCGLSRLDLVEERRRHLRKVKSALIGWETAMLLPDAPEKEHWENELRGFLGWLEIPEEGHGEPYTMMTYAYLQSQGFDLPSLQL